MSSPLLRRLSIASLGVVVVCGPVRAQSIRPDVVVLDLSGAPAGMADSAAGACFEPAFAQAPGPGPRLASLLTSQYPEAEGVFRAGQTLPAGIPTLAGALRAAGYATAAFWGDAASGPGLGRAGFSAVIRRDGLPGALAAALARLDGADRPLLLLIHGRGSPPQCSEASRRLRRALAARGRAFVLAVVSSEDTPDTSALGERQLRASLCFWGASAAVGGRQVSELLGVAPTLLGLAGVRSPETFRGRPFWPTSDSSSKAAAFSSSRAVIAGRTHELASVRDAEWRLVYDATARTASLSRPADDPEGARDLSEAHPEAALDLSQRLLRHVQEAASGAPSPRLLDELRDRGYW